MSRKSSVSSSTTGGDFDVCAVSATSTPVKSSPAPGQSAAGRSPRSPSQSLSLSGGQPSPPTQAAPAAPAAPAATGSPASGMSGRNVQFAAAKQRRRSSGSDGSAADASSRLLGSFLDQSSGGRRSRLDDLNLSEGAWTRDSLARLLEEEAEDVHLASMVGGGLGGGVGPPPRRFPLSESVRHTCNTERVVRAMPVSLGTDTARDSVLFMGEGEEPSNLSPADVAAMMHRLEHGVSMSAPPEQLFKFLFPHASKPNLAGAGKADKTEESDPEASRVAEGEEGGAPTGNTNTLHKDGSCPIVCFGNGLPAPASPQTLLQRRGAAPPPWFPGYFMALPETGGVLEVKRSLTEVMQAAYMAARPCNIPPECRFVY